ncbi:hypothetical protein SERLA73DRAFT_75753 [Serpula lacrymans var. lacrymans S7.3]|uniref:Uncharacterized protein n=2 Tax=Serpula lacrymans var. lacrymans TaxID=341189 RepID=F8Q449_SERL3|nr:uncharacterized protein SERLADRAFT_440525 [Serpula lacrymans var. lacrymans S7.9]EGN96905.1 hypothetical protein SERLA73DRAFT_75753 [Serpula lacrymans var. lacrymans S7.3]EGO22503.1 hypothetical protein SERLADRAFT_440525 [Serpula lacrymans var. lacrymans S7.9]
MSVENLWGGAMCIRGEVSPWVQAEEARTTNGDTLMGKSPIAQESDCLLKAFNTIAAQAHVQLGINILRKSGALGALAKYTSLPHPASQTPTSTHKNPNGFAILG